MLRFMSLFFPHSTPPTQDAKPVPLPPAKVAVIGAGMGGCFAAKFLHENGGKDLDIHVFAKKGSQVGGRVRVQEFNGHTYEVGAVITSIHEKYIVDAIKKHDLPTLGIYNIAIGFFDGKSMFHLSKNIIVKYMQLLWRYGFDLLRMHFFMSNFVKNLNTLYALQENNVAFSNLGDMLEAAGGREMRNLAELSANDYLHGHLNWSKSFIDEFISALSRFNYAQGSSVTAHTVAIFLFPVFANYIRVEGGNHQIAECVLKESTSSLSMEDVVSVTKSEKNGAIKYAITTGDGMTDEDYDVVIVANPLNTSNIKYENFSKEVYTAAATTPYERTAVTLCKGKINQQYFGLKTDIADFPHLVVTTKATESLDFGGAIVEKPHSAQEDWNKDEPIRTWKVYSHEPMSREQCLNLFPDIDPDDTVCTDWVEAYPHFSPPYETPSFVLDDGVFYVNAMEKSGSDMGHTAIAARNAALLTRNYLLQKN